MVVGVEVVECVIGVFFVDDRSFGFQSVFDVENMGQFFVVDAYQSDGVLSGTHRCCDNGQYGLTFVTDPIRCQQWFVITPEIDKR